MARPDPKDFVFRQRKGETLAKRQGEIRGLDFILEELEDCTIYLLDHSSQVQIDACKRCTIVIGPVDGSAFLRDCEDCSVAVACRQLRTRNCKRLDLSLHVATDPIIESSSGVAIAPWALEYPGLEAQFQAANLAPSTNNWRNVYDFTPAPSGEDPHWTLEKAKVWEIPPSVAASHPTETSAPASSADTQDTSAEAPATSDKESSRWAPIGNANSATEVTEFKKAKRSKQKKRVAPVAKDLDLSTMDAAEEGNAEVDKSKKPRRGSAGAFLYAVSSWFSRLGHAFGGRNGK